MKRDSDQVTVFTVLLDAIRNVRKVDLYIVWASALIGVSIPLVGAFVFFPLPADTPLAVNLLVALGWTLIAMGCVKFTTTVGINLAEVVADGE